ncbi:MAG: hypothetical protein SYC29_12480 [Planctomycetota bacterium]|nr:hypothetical protein [Planctomycetota bacterium]
MLHRDPTTERAEDDARLTRIEIGEHDLAEIDGAELRAPNVHTRPPFRLGVRFTPPEATLIAG